MAGTVQKLTNTMFSGTGLPYLERDSLATTGTLLLWDAANPASYSGGVTPPTGTPLSDLARGGTPSTLVVDAAWPVTHDGRGLLMPDQGAANNYNARSYVSHPAVLPTSQSWVALAWVRVRLTGGATSDDYQGVFGQSVNQGSVAAGNQMTLLMRSGSARRAELVVFDAGGTKTTINLGNAAVTDGLLMQIGASVVYSGANAVITGYVNGVAAGSSTVTMAALAAGTGQPFVVGAQSTSFGQSKSRFYRALVENLTTSGRTALSVVQADYAANLSRFS